MTRAAARCRGFTLVELLVSTSLMAMVAATVAATFSGGIGVWQQAQARGMERQWMQAAFGQLRRDLRNVRLFTPVPFRGEYDEMRFATLVPRQPLTPTAPLTDGDELGQLTYFFDMSQRRLCRTHEPYRLLRRSTRRERCAPVLTGVQRARFSFYGQDAQTGEGGWVSAWDAVAPPMAVKLDVRYEDPATRRLVDQVLIVNVPLGQPTRAEDDE